MAAKKSSLEENFAQVEEIIASLQGGELSLEDSFKRYTEGMKLIKNCNDAIDKVEKKLIDVSEET